jgi:hypothetical protein
MSTAAGERIFLKFDLIYGEKWNRTFGGNVAKTNLGIEIWSKHFQCFDSKILDAAITICEAELDWPPSIAELLKIIDRVNGIPNWQQALKLAVRKDYLHPTIELARKKVGSFAMQTDSAKDLEPKFKAAYAEAIREYRSTLYLEKK